MMPVLLKNLCKLFKMFKDCLFIAVIYNLLGVGFFKRFRSIWKLVVFTSFQDICPRFPMPGPGRVQVRANRSAQS
jgi:hypothetical protein